MLVLARFLENAGLLQLLLKAAQRLIQRFIRLNLDLSQLVHPFPCKMDVRQADATHSIRDAFADRQGYPGGQAR